MGENVKRCTSLRRYAVRGCGSVAQRSGAATLEPSNVHTGRPLDPRPRSARVHLRVPDRARALAFYRDAVVFEVTSRYGQDAVFLSAGGYHHHLGLNTWAGRGASPPPRGTTG